MESAVNAQIKDGWNLDGIRVATQGAFKKAGNGVYTFYIRRIRRVIERLGTMYKRFS